jgi:hypothetical protein
VTTTSADQITAEDVRKARAAIEYYYERGWTDGLPVVPPIEEFVQEFLEQTSRDPDEVVMVQSHLHRQCTIRDAAINAVMAGCKPEYFPVLLAAMDAFTDAGGGGGLLQSTTGQCQLMIINGPVRDRLGINYTHNIFGPGDRANSTIGRALRLIILNVLDIRPHDLDQSTHATPAKYTFCIAENQDESPWEPMHVELGFAEEQSTVTIQMARSDLHVEHRSTQEPEEILHTIADSMSYAGAIYEAPPFNRNNGGIVVIGPEHAQIIASKGWSKQDVRQFLYEHWGRPVSDLRRFGKGIDDEVRQLADDDFVKNTSTPDNIKIVVSGASNAGVSTVVVGFVSRSGTRPIDLP